MPGHKTGTAPDLKFFCTVCSPVTSAGTPLYDPEYVFLHPLAKGCLAPLTLMTIPRLELKAAVLAVQISTIIKRELRLIISATEFYSDCYISCAPATLVK